MKPGSLIWVLAAVFLLCLCFSSVSAAALEAAFNGTPRSGTAPLPVSFTDLSSNSPTGWAWYFGDENYMEAWTQVNASTVNASAGWSARSGHSSVTMQDGSIILMGGLANDGSGSNYKNDVWRSTDKGATWTQVNASAGWSVRFRHSSVVTSDNIIVLMGGYESGVTLKNDVWLSADKGATWTQVNVSAGWSGREGHSSVVMPDGSIVLTGGHDIVTFRNDVWRSTDKGATWTQVNKSAGWSGREGHSSVVMPDDSIVLMGGLANDNSGSDYKNDVWRSMDNGATWTQQTVHANWTGRMWPGSVAMPDGSIVLMGGYQDGGVKNDVWRSMDNGATWMDVNWNALWSARWAHSSVVLSDNSIVLMGGYTGSYPSFLGKNDVWRSKDNGTTWAQMNGGPGWSARVAHSSVVTPEGSIVLMGGYDNDEFKNDVWQSTDKGVTWAQVVGHAEWSGRYAHSSIVIPDGSIVLTGGYDNVTYRNDVWRSINDGATWTRMTASAGWTGRIAHSSIAMADGSIILTGGYDSSGTLKNDVWRSTDKGTTWTQVNASAGWLPREWHSSVVMPDGSIVLTGGEDSVGYRNDTWRSIDKGTTWTQLNTGAGWSARGAHSSIAMPDGSIMLMGGGDGIGIFKNDVWRSKDNGVTWTQLPDAGWPGRVTQRCVVMPDGSIILMGGYQKGGYRNDVWQFIPIGSSAQNPSHTYTATGIYTVVLQAYNADGYDSLRKTGYICVGVAVLPLPGSSYPPTDPDGDCIYEDLNANNRKDFNDVVLMFNQMQWIAANEPVSAFDFNGNGRIDFNDIVKLFGEI